jgi:ABC-type bacteriocin/lantibiotic exporter with double-glycine peptidase domain
MEVSLPPRSEEAVSRSTVEVEPIYLQADPDWATEKIGGSGERLARVGCTICCLSMALAHHGVTLNPLELNRKIKEVDGYTYRGWVKWDSVRQVTGEEVHVELPQKPSNKDIEKALDQGNPVLVKVVLRSGVQHWVLVVGRDGKEYLMKDPLGDGKSLEPLSSLGSDILAVRIVRRM